MHISVSTITEIRAKTKMSVLVESYGIKIVKEDGLLRACCPFHSDESPSFGIDDQNGVFRCFGCGAKGDVIEFIHLMENVSYAESVTLLAKRGGIGLAYERDFEDMPMAEEGGSVGSSSGVLSDEILAIVKKVTQDDLGRRGNPVIFVSADCSRRSDFLRAVCQNLNEGRDGRKIICVRAEPMFDLFLSAYRSKTIPILRESICGADVLLLDAAGHMTKGSVFQQELLIIVNEFLSSSKQVVLATEKPLSATDGSYHSRRMLSRILSGCEVCPVKS